jgi:gliding motility-associated-like protein
LQTFSCTLRLYLVNCNQQVILKKLYQISFLFILSILSITLKAQFEFVENKGQWDAKVKYRSDFPTGSFFLENNGFTVQLLNPQDVEDFASLNHHTHSKKAVAANRKNDLLTNGLKTHVYKVEFLGANFTTPLIAEKPLNTYNNYYIGNNPSNWANNCKVYGAVTYQNIYPNIDVRYYADEGNLKYDLIVKPGGNPNQILMKYMGIDNLKIKNDELVINTSVGEVKELYPYTYQNSFGKQNEVNCKYVIEDDIVRFKVKNYDTKETLVIDPSLIFSSFTGSTGDNWGYTATPGANGSLYAGGIAINGNFPITIGPGSINGQYDIAIFQFSPNGAQRVYATYVGGSAKEQPHSLIAKSDGSLIIAGRSNSNNFPKTLTNITQAGIGGGYDIIVVKLNPNGSLAASAKIGGSGDDGVNINIKDDEIINPTVLGTDVLRRNYGDDARSEVILDASGNIYLASCTKSTNANGYPVFNAVQNTFGGGRQDGVIIKFDPDLSSVLFNTYYGGSGDDACFVLAINPITGILYVAGGTSSNNLLGDKTGVLQPNYQGGETDGFITSLLPNGSAFSKTTYQGINNAADIIYGIQFDKKGFPYTTGTTTGTWPVQNATFSNTGAKQFITKLQPDLSSYVYSTVFGAPNSLYPNISPTAFLVDRCENVYVSGWGGDLNTEKNFRSSGTLGMPELSPLAGIPAPDGSDFFFFVMEKDAQAQLFGSHFGQNGGAADHVDGGTSRFDASGIIYQGVCANCGGGVPFPTTVGAWRTANGAGTRGCNQAALKIEMNFSGVAASLQAKNTLGTLDTLGCVPFTVLFTDTLAKGKTYIWDPGDGSGQQTTVAPNNFLTHTYNSIGRFRAMLISIDPSTCNVSDTAFAIIRVGDNAVQPNFRYTKVGDCNSLEFEFENTSTAGDATKFNSNTFIWDFGDGTPSVKQGFTPNIRHTFPAPGPYTVRLLVDDSLFCNAPIFKDSLLRLASNVRARFTTPAFGCAPYNAVFRNTSIGGTNFIWQFGDGQESSDGSPTVTHPYANPGTYNVRLIAIDDNTCNKRDTTAFFTITVFSKPVARFDWGVQPPQANTRTFFTNLSIGATRYLWNFGDGETSTDVNPVHQYNETNNFTVVLVAYNAAGCTDTFPLTVSAIINPLLDVPNAFTPGKFGINGIVKVVGFGIAKMNWKIYNRWGQLVFESQDRRQGWDGTFKGVLQPMDVYTYTLEAEFSDGKKMRKTGDINLLR